MEKPVTPLFRLKEKVCVDPKAATILGLDSDIRYTILAIKVNEKCEVDNEDHHCSKFCKFRTTCRKGTKMIHQLIAVEDVKEFYPASYFEKAA